MIHEARPRHGVGLGRAEAREGPRAAAAEGRLMQRSDSRSQTYIAAQGSQWLNVVLFDESKVFKQDAARWLYTAITRACDTVTVVLPSRRSLSAPACQWNPQGA